MYAVDEHDDPRLVSDQGYVTDPAVVATLSLAGTSPRMVGDPSIVRPGTDLQLITTKAMFDARLDLEEAATVGTEIKDVKVDRLDLEAVDGGISVSGAGHKTGASVTFDGTVLTRYRGGTNGQLAMLPAIHTDVDTDWWVDMLTVVGIVMFPFLGLVLADIFVWDPQDAAPGQVDNALQDRFTAPLIDAANQVTKAFGVKKMRTAAYLADLWIFDGNFAVAVAAFLGAMPTDVKAVT